MVNQLYGSRIRATLICMQSEAMLDLESITSPRSLGMEDGSAALVVGLNYGPSSDEVQ